LVRAVSFFLQAGYLTSGGDREMGDLFSSLDVRLRRRLWGYRCRVRDYLRSQTLAGNRDPALVVAAMVGPIAEQKWTALFHAAARDNPDYVNAVLKLPFDFRVAAAALCLPRATPACVPVLRAVVSSPRVIPALRASCATALGRVGGVSEASMLLEALCDPSEQIQAAAHRALRRVLRRMLAGGPEGSQAAKAVIVAALAGTDSNSRDRLIGLLGRSVRLLGALVVDILRSGCARARAAAASTLGLARNAAFAEPLADALDDSDGAVRTAAAGALEQLLRQPRRGPRGVVPVAVLTRCLAVPGPLAVSAAEGLARIDADATAVGLLTGVLLDDSRPIADRAAAAAALGNRKAVSAVGPLAAGVACDVRLVGAGAAAITAILQSAPLSAFVPALVQVAAVPDRGLGALILDSLAGVDPPSRIPVLTAILRTHSSVAVRDKALAMLSEAESRRILSKHLGLESFRRSTHDT
jgi:HEAT repeat protein